MNTIRLTPMVFLTLAVILRATCVSAATIPGTWSLVDHSFSARDKFAVSCWDQRMLVFGGRTSSTAFANSIFGFHPTTGWEELFAVSAPAPRHGIRMHRFDNEVFAFGGNFGVNGLQVSSDVNIFHIARQEWRHVPIGASAAWPAPRSKYGSIRRGTSFVVFGGLTEREMTGEVWSFNTQTYSWTQLHDGATGTAPSPRFDLCCDYSQSADTTYCFGGTAADGDKSDVWAFNHATNAWTQANTASSTNTPSARRLAACSMLDARGEFVIVGGFDSRISNFVQDTSVHTLTLSTGAWTKTPQTTAFVPRDSHAMCENSDGVFVLGGAATSPSRLNDIWKLDVATKQLSIVVAQSFRPVPRQGHCAVTVSETMFAFFGVNSDGFLSDIWALNLITLKWGSSALRTTGITPVGRQGAAAATVGRLIFVHGGLTANGFTSELLSFDVTDRIWTAVTQNGDRPVARGFHQLAFLRDRELILVGGRSASNAALADMFVFSLQLQLWKRVTFSSTSSTTFTGRRLFSMVRDFATNSLYIFGGLGTAGTNTDRFRISEPREDATNPKGATQVRLDQLSSILPAGETDRSYIRAEAAVAGYGSHYIICGGAISASFPAPLADRCYQYDVNTFSNSRMALSPVAAFASTAVYSKNRYILFGGQLMSEAVKREVYLDHLQVYTISMTSVCPLRPNASAATSLEDATCMHCSEGSQNPAVPTALGAACTPAPRGAYVERSYTDAQLCSRGRFNGDLGATSSSFCQLCPAGFYSDREGAEACLNCTGPCRLGAESPTDSEVAGVATGNVTTSQPKAYEPVPVPPIIYIILAAVVVGCVLFLSLTVLLSAKGQESVLRYYLSEADVQHLRDLYNAETRRDPLGLKRVSLQKVMRAFQLGNVPNSVVEELFNSFNVDGSSHINFDELLLIVADVFRRDLVPPREGTQAYADNHARFVKWVDDGMTPETKPKFARPSGFLATINRIQFSHLDMFTSGHRIGNIGDAATYQRTTVGGIITVMFGFLVLVLVAALLITFFYTNIFETRGTIPEVSLNKTITGDFELTYHLHGAEAALDCVAAGTICADATRVVVTQLTDSSISAFSFPSQELTCTHSVADERCTIQWRCTGCTINPLAKVQVALETDPDLFAAAADISLKVSSGIQSPGSSSVENSELLVKFNPTRNTTVFRGHPSATVDVQLVPTYFETIRNAIDQTITSASGYHAQVLSTTPGHEVTHQDYNQYFGAPLTITMTPADTVLLVSRKPLQTVLALITSILGSLSGLSGGLLVVVQQFDQYFQKKRNAKVAAAREAEERQLQRDNLAGSMHSSTRRKSLDQQLRDLQAVQELTDAGVSANEALAHLRLIRKVVEGGDMSASTNTGNVSTPVLPFGADNEGKKANPLSKDDGAEAFTE